MHALDLLTAELAAIRKLADTDRVFAHEWMQYWLTDNDIACVRDPKRVSQLPPPERDAWTKFWAAVRDLREHTAPRTGPAEKVPE